MIFFSSLLKNSRSIATLFLVKIYKLSHCYYGEALAIVIDFKAMIEDNTKANKGKENVKIKDRARQMSLKTRINLCALLAIK
jgi:hypothetical protein